MNALERNRYTDAWRDLSATLPRPRAILAVSAHWYTNATAVTAMDRPRTIHDFFGFPDELFAFEYPCAGSLEVAQEVAAVEAPALGRPRPGQLGHRPRDLVRALAHVPGGGRPGGPTRHQRTRTARVPLRLGTPPGPARATVASWSLASGNVVHNLGLMDGSKPDEGFAWAQRFDEAAQALVVDSPDEVLSLAEHPDYRVGRPHARSLRSVGLLCRRGRGGGYASVGRRGWLHLRFALHDLLPGGLAGGQDTDPAPTRGISARGRGSFGSTNQRDLGQWHGVDVDTESWPSRPRRANVRRGCQRFRPLRREKW